MKNQLEAGLNAANIKAEVELGRISYVFDPGLGCSLRNQFVIPYDLILSKSLERARVMSSLLLAVNFVKDSKREVRSIVKEITIKNLLKAINAEGYIVLAAEENPNHPKYIVGKNDEVYAWDEHFTGEYLCVRDFCIENRIDFGDALSYWTCLELLREEDYSHIKVEKSGDMYCVPRRHRYYYPGNPLNKSKYNDICILLKV